MRVKIKRVSKTAKSYRMYLPEEIGKKFEGDNIECLPNAITLTIIRPNVTEAQIEHSLEIILDDMRLRRGKKPLRSVIKPGEE